jgi:hypothetical protein
MRKSPSRDELERDLGLRISSFEAIAMSRAELLLERIGLRNSSIEAISAKEREDKNFSSVAVSFEEPERSSWLGWQLVAMVSFACCAAFMPSGFIKMSERNWLSCRTYVMVMNF